MTMLRIAVCLLLAVTSFASPGVDFSLTTDELQRYFGVSSHEKAPEYEIVYPKVVGTDSKRNVGLDAIAASSLEIQIDVFGQTLELALEHDASSITPGLVAEYVSADETITTVPVQTDCLYTGKVKGQSKSLVSVGACKGLIAVINHADGPTYIEPLEEEHATKRDIGRGLPHIAYKRVPHEGTFCQVESEDSKYVDEDDGNQMVDDITPQATRYLKLAFISDSLVYDIRGSGTQNCLTVLFNAVKNVMQLNALDATYSLEPKLVHMKIFTSAEAGLKTCQDASTSLGRAAAWQNSNRLTTDKNAANYWDNAVVMTGWELNSGRTLGIAYVGNCDNKNAVSVNTFRSLLATNVVAHEIGHNLNMQHDSDGNGCSSSGYIMGAYANDYWSDPSWSSCSKSYYNGYVANNGCYTDA